MPRTWIYFIALIIPALFGILVMHTGFVEWVWYQRQEEAYYTLSALKVHPLFIEFIGGWPLVVFTVTAFCYWSIDYDDEAIAHQFLLLPIAYVPFSILGTMLATSSADGSLFYTHPLIIIPAGYVYLFPWIVFVWVFSKLKLVM